MNFENTNNTELQHVEEDPSTHKDNNEKDD